MLHLSRDESVETTCKCSVNKYKTEYNTLENGGGDSLDNACPVHSEYSLDRANDNSMILKHSPRKRNNKSTTQSQSPSTKAFKLKLE
jgi:hypothetical protein